MHIQRTPIARSAPPVFTPPTVSRVVVGQAASVSVKAGADAPQSRFGQVLSAAVSKGTPTTSPSKTSSTTPVPAQYTRLIQTTAKRYGVPPALVAAVVKAESGFDSRAESSAGAKGLMQLMDGTAKGLGVKDSFNPVQNVEGGVKYLRGLLERYDGDVRLALAAYNAGPGAVDQYGGVPPYEETQTFVGRVLTYAQDIARSSSSQTL
jgi:soluble lytic murein transglycosylase-like protein